MADKHPLMLFLAAQAFFLAIFLGYKNSTMEDVKQWILLTARFVVYLTLIRYIQELFSLADQSLRSNRRPDWSTLNAFAIIPLGISLVAIYLSEKPISLEECLILFVATIISQFFFKERNSKLTINYGRGMALSFFEGYLKLIIPSDGTVSNIGFEDNIRAYEATQGVVFPVRKLLLVITKSLFCPPDMNHYNNRHNPDLAWIEGMAPLDDMVRDVAGVRGRSYRNSAYRINRRAPALPVYAAVEFATPLHTLYKVLQNRNLYAELCDVDQEELVRDFCWQLERVIEKSPDTRGKCKLIHFDDTVPNANLADVLLEKIQELEPNFEEILQRAEEENQ